MIYGADAAPWNGRCTRNRPCIARFAWHTVSMIRSASDAKFEHLVAVFKMIFVLKRVRIVLDHSVFEAHSAAIAQMGGSHENHCCFSPS